MLMKPHSFSLGHRVVAEGFARKPGHSLKPPNATESRPLALPLAFQYFARQGESKPLSVLPVMYLGTREKPEALAPANCEEIVNVRGTTRLTGAAIGEVLNRVCDVVI
jgi:hypothetical protein